MIFKVEKFSGFSLVLKNRRYSTSARRMLFSFCTFLLSEMEGSFMIDSSSSALSPCQQCACMVHTSQAYLWFRSRAR